MADGSGSNGQTDVLRKLGPLTQQQLGRSAAASQRVPASAALECTGKPYLLKAQHSALNISNSTTIPLTVQNWQITSFVPDSTDLVVDSRNKCLAVRTVGMQRCPGFHKNVSFAK